MKATFSRAALSEALGIITSIVPTRTPKPILKCILIEATDDNVRFAATDMEVGINYYLSGVDVQEPGGIVVPADELSSIVRESADEVLAVRADEQTCNIEGADSRFTIYGQQLKQFPKVPDFEGEAELRVGLGMLQGGIGQCLFATAKESTRYALNGILWELKGKKLLLVATDGRRLAKCRVSLSDEPSKDMAEQGIIVPAKTMGLMGRVDGRDELVVEVKRSDNHVIMRCDNVVVSSNLVDGKFPNYDDIIPTDYDKKLTMSTAATLSAVRRAALLTTQESRGIKLSVTKDKVVLSGRAPETGDATVEMKVDYKGEPVDIGFNPQFLIDALRVIEKPEFNMELGEPDRPGVIKCGNDFLYVLMPISLG